MKSFILNSAALSVLALTLTACITQTTGRVQTGEKPVQAADLNTQLGIGYLRQGDWQSALVKLQKAVELDRNNVIAHRALGLVYQNLGDTDGAERHFRRAVLLAPQDPDALNSLAAFLCPDDDRRNEALRLFDRALAIPLSTAVSNKAMLYTNAGVCLKGVDLERSENYLRSALAADPKFSDALLQVADVSYQRGNYLQSRAFLQRHMVIGALSPSALWLGVQVEQSLGDFPAADEFGAQLRKDFPESVETRLLLEQLRDAG